MINITFKQLEVFTMVARKLSFSLAANSLFLTQPAISKQIRNLEQQSGGPLFEKIGKKIYLTERGQQLLKFTEKVILEMEVLKSSLKQDNNVVSGKLRMGMRDTLQHIIFDILADFCHLYPKVNFSIAVNNYPALSDQLFDNQIDFAVTSKTGSRVGLTSELLMKVEPVIITSPQHHLAKKHEIKLKELKNEMFIVGSQDSPSYELTQMLMSRAKSPEENLLQIGSYEAVKYAIKANFGIAVIAKFALHSELKAGSLVALKITDFKPTNFNLYWVQHVDKQLSIATRLFKEFLLKNLKQMAGLWPDTKT